MPTWDGEDVWLVGSGPSAAEFDLRALAGRRVLAINDAVFPLVTFNHFPAAAIFSLDPRWMLHRRDFLSTYRGEKYLATPRDYALVAGISGVAYLKYSSERGLSDDLDAVCTGGHSGYGALGVAYHKRAGRVFLVGYDLVPGGGNPYDSQYRFWARNYRDALPQLRARGIEVFNCNPRSAIDAFPFVDPATVLNPSSVRGGI